jgi:hypothetical protein
VELWNREIGELPVGAWYWILVTGKKAYPTVESWNCGRQMSKSWLMVWQPIWLKGHGHGWGNPDLNLNQDHTRSHAVASAKPEGPPTLTWTNHFQKPQHIFFSLSA